MISGGGVHGRRGGWLNACACTHTEHCFLFTKTLFPNIVQSVHRGQPQELCSPPVQGNTSAKKKTALRGIPSLSAAPVSSVIMNSGKRETHIPHSDAFAVSEGPLWPNEDPPTPPFD